MGSCVERAGGRVVVARGRGDMEPCYSCLVITTTHTNLIHYKQSGCLYTVITMIQWQLCSPQLPAQPGQVPAVLAVPLHPGRCSPLHTLQGGRRLHQVEIWDD